MINTTSLDNIPIKYEETRKLCNEFVKELLNDETHNEGGKLHKLSHFKKFVQGVLKDTRIQSVTRADVADFFKREGVIPRLCVMKFLYFSEQYLSDDLKRLLTVGDWLSGYYRVSSVVEVCESSTPEQYFLTYCNKRKTWLFCFTDVPYELPLFQIAVAYAKQFSGSSVALRIFLAHLYEAIGDQSITDIEDLSIKAYTNAAMFYTEAMCGKEIQKVRYALTGFFRYCGSFGINFLEKDNLDIKVFEKFGLARHLSEGYEIIKYSKLDDVPCSDKWALVYEAKNDKGVVHPISEIRYVDFTQIHNKTFRAWVKLYFWNTDTSIRCKAENVIVLKDFLNYINSIRKAEVLTIFCHPGKPDEEIIDFNEIAAYLAKLESEKASETQMARATAIISKFFKEIRNCSINAPNGISYFLYRKAPPRVNSANAIPEDDLNMIAEKIVLKESESIFNSLCCSLFRIQLETELRISEIIALDYDCIFETAKKNEYVIVLKRKTSGNTKEEVPITRYVKAEIDHVKEVTKELRKTAPDYLKKKLFITSRKGTVSARRITPIRYREYIFSICESLGLPKYGPNNIRDTHMTLALRQKIKNKLSDLELMVLGGHKSREVIKNHYSDLTLQEVNEMLNGVIIGDIDVETGEIIEDEKQYEESSIVSDGCGFCSNDACNDLTLLGCLMCKHFVTMPTRRSYFEEAIKKIDHQILDAGTQHDREDLLAIKRLHVAFLVAIDEFVERKKNASA